MFFQIKSYLRFLLRSTNQHGIHSPFIYNLATQCFYDYNVYEHYKILHNYRQGLLNNHNTISISDFGAGSKKLQQKQRSISSIAKTAGISTKRAQLLYRLVKYFNPQNILEIGTSLGVGSASLALANANTQIISLEGCPETANIAQQQLNKHSIKNVQLKVGEFSKTIPEILVEQDFDLIYFDGNHQKEPTINYFEQCINSIHNNSVFIFDDIYWSKGMSEAWFYIKNYKKVTVSIDTFQWGLVFFRKEQPKQHFTIRI